MRRHLLGVIAVVLIVGGFVGAWVSGESISQMGLVTSACIRMGCVFGAIWLAFPQIQQVSAGIQPWVFGCILLGGLAVAIFSRKIVALLPLVAALVGLQILSLVLRPRPPKPQRKNPPGKPRKEV